MSDEELEALWILGGPPPDEERGGWGGGGDGGGPGCFGMLFALAGLSAIFGSGVIYMIIAVVFVVGLLGRRD